MSLFLRDLEKRKSSKQYVNLSIVKHAARHESSRALPIFHKIGIPSMPKNYAQFGITESYINRVADRMNWKI